MMLPSHARHHDERRTEPLRVGDEFRRRDRDTGRRGGELCDRLLPEVVVTKRPGGGGRDAYDEVVCLLAAVPRRREVDEDGFARIPNGRMFGVDDSHVVRSGSRRDPACERVADLLRISMRQERHPNLLRHLYSHAGDCKDRVGDTQLAITPRVVTALGPLGPLDELLAHQIVDTFATVSQSDRSWTEKICAMAGARDGSIVARFRARQVSRTAA